MESLSSGVGVRVNSTQTSPLFCDSPLCLVYISNTLPNIQTSGSPEAPESLPMEVRWIALESRNAKSLMPKVFGEALHAPRLHGLVKAGGGAGENLRSGNHCWSAEDAVVQLREIIIY